MTPSNTSYDYPLQNASGATCISQAWAKTPKLLDPQEKDSLIRSIKEKIIEKDAVLIAHYYVDGSRILQLRLVGLLPTL